jgi:hypothetical protein
MFPFLFAHNQIKNGTAMNPTQHAAEITFMKPVWLRAERDSRRKAFPAL